MPERSPGSRRSEPSGAPAPTAGAGVVVTCEHAGNRVPGEYRRLFRGAREVLRSHRGWDSGAAPLAEAIAETLGVEPLLHYETRLLIDLNRSLRHPHCLSEYSRGLTGAERQTLIDQHYRPHRSRVQRAVEATLESQGSCLHLSIHTFTPELDGVERTAEVALLYDPARPRERATAARWREGLREVAPSWRIRRNYPYLGAADGLTTTLRRRHPDPLYAGIELEVNEAILRTASDMRATRVPLCASLGRLFGGIGAG